VGIWLGRRWCTGEHRRRRGGSRRRPRRGCRGALVLLTDRVVSELRQDIYDVLPDLGRIVILGGPGAGKTTTMLLLLIDVLAERAKAVETGSADGAVGPVPVWLTLGGWSPHELGLLEYAADVVTRDYPGLVAYAGFGTAAELLKAGRIALFLDGLDEMPDEVRAPALEAIDKAASGLRVVVTSRPGEFASASVWNGLWDAAVIEIQAVDLEHACEFLLLQQKGARRAAWEKVTVSMRENPDGVAAQALRNPLVLSLARDTYTRTHEDPADLTAYTSQDALLQHLLARLLVNAYPDPAEYAHAVYWLSWIAEKLDDERDICWWDVSGWIVADKPQASRNFGLFSGLVFGLVLGLSSGLMSGLMHGLDFGLIHGLAFGLMHALVFGIVFGVISGIILGVTFRSALRGVPKALILRRPGREQMRHLASELSPLLVAGVVFGSVSGLLSGLGSGLAHGIVVGLWFGSVWCLTTAITKLMSLWSSPMPDAAANSPSEMHAKDRRRTLVFASGLALALQVGFGFVAILVYGVKEPLAGPLFIPLVGLLLGLVIGWGPAAQLSWLEHFWLSRWRPVHFIALLQTALERQVLRQAGAVYQFRHAALQDLLALSGPSRAGDVGDAGEQHGRSKVVLPPSA
jgi:hypothetical protein